VLVVDDNLTNCIVVRAMATRMGLEVAEVHDGQKAVDAVMAGEGFDVVLMDIQMPLLDGYGATCKIRQWEQENARPRTPIVALTADAYDADRARAMDSGMDDFLPKPLKMQDLQSLFARWIPAGPREATTPDQLVSGGPDPMTVP
jgi:CheY-like chemotaxis protein